jgi:hypothetical protein
MFRSERYHASHSFDLPRPVDTCLPLFTAEGERDWVPDWSPTFVYPADGRTEAGMVFLTHQDGGITTWAMTVHEPAEGRVAYVRITPGFRVVQIRVICRPIEEGRGCRVSVAYELTGLSEAGNAAGPGFVEGFPMMIEGWRSHILAYFDRQG